MEWRDIGIVIGTRRFGESGLILDAFTRDHGRQSGLIYGGASSKKKASFEIGTSLELEWRARTADALGHFNLSEPTAHRAAISMGSRLALSALQSVTALLNSSLPEGHSYPALFDATETVLDHLGDEELWPPLMVSWEVGFLRTVGYGLDFTKCTVSGRRDGLSHVSPRTGRAVCGAEVPEYVDKLLELPGFLVDSSADASAAAIGQGFRLTGYFIENRLYAEAHQPPPGSRELMLRRLQDKGLISFG
ncbi:DNA repair protein RecO [Ponticaulis profundi]|uniref:DNA repair protein RecO n=1 Tax=Ponticaulis profundi TaxID=2665222 RepID=A0ABW1S7G0_9PROT